ncbi:hypothetical protein ONR75_10960 [Rhodopseudomonas sp. P2A-2r]|uniref:hypothetical protein n=1 Tax=Rhodopseudomonas sp. P2A-2r TaxID=2991972 RepID=UPI0022345EA5|nr:hypothetical protein [Rhodopseudomonas sp. P2A-2r]UZE51083.1 hypothetical protein ONR75_10960 [Rhodopseudomonas sp. P2A-2r]
MNSTFVSIVSFFGVMAPLMAFFVILDWAGRKAQTQGAQRTSLDKLKAVKLLDLTLFLKRLAAGAIIVAFTIGAPVGLFALILFFPTITCHGEGSGGNCGEGYMASIPLALLTIPLDLAAAFFVCKILVSAFWPKQ